MRAAPEDLDGWELAGDLSAGALSYAGERAYLCAQQLAAAAVLQRAARLVGPVKAATRTVREPMLEPWGGELDVEATVENLLGKPHPEPGDLIVQRRVDRRHQVVLMIDTSLSMAGEKMALAAVAAAVLALKLRPGDLAWCCSPTAPGRCSASARRSSRPSWSAACSPSRAAGGRTSRPRSGSATPSSSAAATPAAAACW